MKATLVFFLLMVFALPCEAQWQYVGRGTLDGDGGSSEGGDGAMTVHDSILFVSDPSQIWRYTIARGWGPARDSGLGFTLSEITSFASLGKYLFAGMIRTDNGANSAMFYTSDEGSTWQLVQAFGPAATNGTYLFGSGFSTAYRSRDTGNTWSNVINHFNPKYYAASGTYCLVDDGGSIWRSIDSGDTNKWSQLTTPSGISLSAFAVLGKQMFAGGTGVFRSLDNGAHWTQIGLSTRTIYALASYGTYLFAGNDTGILVSSDSGMTWRDVSQGMEKQPKYYYKDVKLLAILDTFLFADVYSGTDVSGNVYGYVARRPISEMISPSDVVDQMPPGDTIEVYPNPATAQVSILASSTSIISIHVLNVLGTEVRALPGMRESALTLDLSKLPSGTYFLEIETAKGTALRKVVRE